MNAETRFNQSVLYLRALSPRFARMDFRANRLRCHQPFPEFAFVSEHSPFGPARNAMHRQRLLFFPSAHSPLVACEEGSDFLPGIKAAPRILVWRLAHEPYRVQLCPVLSGSVCCLVARPKVYPCQVLPGKT